MKVNICNIVVEHFHTLRDADARRVSCADIVTFYGIPLGCGVAAYVCGFGVKSDVYNVSITFFGIFLALLLNIQVAIFGIFQRKWPSPQDQRQVEFQKEKLDVRQKILRELNVNISYLTVFCSFSLLAFLLFYVFERNCGVCPALGCAIYMHFILTFVMIVKRSYVLFHVEYSM